MKKHIKCLYLLGCALLLGACSGSQQSSSQSAVSRTSDHFEETYKLYATVKIPKHTFVSSKGEATVDGVVTIPDGSSYKVSSISLKTIGKYYVRYSANIAGENFSHEESFLVNKPMFSFENTTSSVSLEVPDFASGYTNAKGVYITLAKGDTLTLNQPFDVNGFTKNDPLVTGFVTPLVQGSFDFSRFHFTLTDSENPDIKMSISLRGQASVSTYPEYSYWSAAGENQVLTGRYTRFKDGQFAGYEYQKGGSLGTIALFPFHAANNKGSMDPTPIDPADQQFSFAYDSEDIALHTTCTHANLWPESTKCADFDNPDYFNSHLWYGFPSGKVYLSISASSFQSNASRFCITSVRGVDLTKEIIPDTEGPEISIEDKFGPTLPEGQINCAYPLPNATAYDVGEKENKEVKTKVIYNYGTSNATLVNINNNSFVPLYKGNYGIVYSASDSFGNESTKTYMVHVGKEITNIDFELDPLPDSILAGNPLEIGEPKNITGGVGMYSYKVSVEDARGKQDINENEFYPRVIGKQTITYTVSDYVGNSTEENVEVNVLSNSEPVLKSINDLEDDYLTEYANKLPIAKAYVTEGEDILLKDCDVVVNDIQGETKYSPNQDQYFVVKADQTSHDADISFKIGDKTLYTKNVELIDALTPEGAINIVDYFSGVGFDASRISGDIENGVLIENNQEVSTINFRSKLTAADYALLLKSHTAKLNFNKFRVILRDSNPECDETLTIAFDGTYFTIGDSPNLYDFTFADKDQIYISFSGTSVSINEVSYSVDCFDSGKKFLGFSSGFVKMQLQAEGAQTSFVLYRINNFALYKASDYDLPDYVINGDYGGSYSVGSDYVVNSLICADVVKPYSYATVTISVNGNVVSDKTGKQLKNVPADETYVVTLSEVGMYSVVYTFFGEIKTFTYAVYSNDVTPPTISILTAIPNKAKINDTIQMPQFELSDDITPIDRILYITSVCIPTGYEEFMTYNMYNEETDTYDVVNKDKTSFVIRYTGTYRLKILAIDEAGNSTLKVFDIIVE